MKHIYVMVALSGCLLLAGCASTPKPTTPTRPIVPPASLLPPSAIGFDFQWRQRVSAHWPTGKQSFDAVLQKRAGELILVGLSPMGQPGFVLRLREQGALEVENRTGKDLPFEPGYVLADVQRVFFPWLPAPVAGWSGEQRGQRGDSAVVERYQAGQLLERRFERQTPAGAERVTIRYVSPLQAAQDAPERVVLDNPLLGYSLSIETLEQSRLQ
jgi:hypothetical protein